MRELSIHIINDYIIIVGVNLIMVSIKDIFIKDVYIDNISQCINKQNLILITGSLLKIKFTI